MSLKETVTQLFSQNTNYADPQQAVNQAASLTSISSDLYQDSKRFIYELLQNADDSAVSQSKVRVAIHLFGNQLVVAHTGKAFDQRDLRGLCAVDNGTKKNSPEKTGFKGIGFKSVFGQSNNVTIFSDSEYFRFDSSFPHQWKVEWVVSKEQWEKDNDRVFTYPWQIIPIATEPTEVLSEIHQFLKEGDWQVATVVTLKNIVDTQKAINELAEQINMFLFLKNIQVISIDVGQPKLISLEYLNVNEVSLKLNGTEKARWLKRSIRLDVPQDTKNKLREDLNVPEKLKSANQVELTLAAKWGENGLEAVESSEQLIYAYLPTEEKKYALPVLVNAAFHTAANRETLHKESPWNEWLFYCISKEILEWIAALAKSAIQQQAYLLLPTPIDASDSLANHYNIGLEKALETVPFLLNTSQNLLRIDEAILDYTFLSTRSFVGHEPIKAFVIETETKSHITSNPFLSFTTNGRKLKSLGTASFDWFQLPELLKSSHITLGYTAEKNMSLIAHLKNLSDNGKVKEVKTDNLKHWPFILDQRMHLKSPIEIFFPSQEQGGINEESDTSFVNPSIQKWLDTYTENKLWLEVLGVVEKSDLTFLTKTILPNVEHYITIHNAIATIQKIFNLFQKNELSHENLNELYKIKLLTIEGGLLQADKCYLADMYLPRLSLQNYISTDIIVSTNYINSEITLHNWKDFMISIGVKEGISVQIESKRKSKISLESIGFEQPYFDLPDKKFTPFIRTFTATEYRNLISLFLLNYTKLNIHLSIVFWRDVISYKVPSELTQPATAFWGNESYPGYTTGDSIANYLSWYITDISCLPATNNQCFRAGDLFINDESITNLVGEYLPVFNGPNLSNNWRAFFKFKTQLRIPDYLQLLSNIANDSKAENKLRIQEIYFRLLEDYPFWNIEQQEIVKEWSKSGLLVDTNGIYRTCVELKYYVDGDNSIFNGGYNFIELNRRNKSHTNLEDILALFQIELLRQSEFKLLIEEENKDIKLTNKLLTIIPYWAKWIDKDEKGSYEKHNQKLDQQFELLTIFQADELAITYGQSWQKKVYLHYANNCLYVLNPWDSTKVMMSLPDVICEHFKKKGYRTTVEFLLRSTLIEIKDFFIEEGIELPLIEENESITEPDSVKLASVNFNFDPKVQKDYYTYWSENIVRNKELLARFGDNPQEFLLNGLQAQKPSEELYIYHFSHLENAVSIIQQGAIKSRHKALFKDSAGSGIIAQTDDIRKEFARFYFRPRTPTQYYVENLGRSDESIAKVGSDPVCPVPVFFIVPLRTAIEQTDWAVSIGSLASQGVPYGSDIDILKKFDFDGVYKDMPEISMEKYVISAHQEFLVKDQLSLAEIDFHLAVQDASAKKALLSMLNDDDIWEAKVSIQPSLYIGQNIKVDIDLSENDLKAKINKNHDGIFVLQQSAIEDWVSLQSNLTHQYKTDNWLTTFSDKEIFLQANLLTINFKFFYHYKGHLWLIHTNTIDYQFETDFIYKSLNNWYFSETDNIFKLMGILKQHPELAYWYSQPVGGPDKLTLEEHTIQVIENFQSYFKYYQRFFKNNKDFMLCLALHDIGKPSAIESGDKNRQHKFTLSILEKIKLFLPIDNKTLENIIWLIDGDILGQYLNPKYNESIDQTLLELHKLADKLALNIKELWSILVIYYQCDAAGYESLRQSLFLRDQNGTLVKVTDQSRLLFTEKIEHKFQKLEVAVTQLS